MECPTCGQSCDRDFFMERDEKLADLRYQFSELGVSLTPMEAKILYALKDKSRPVSRNLLMENIYGFRPDGEYAMEKTVDVVICRIRKKIKRAKLPWLLKTVWGFGYELQERKTAGTLKRAALALAIALPLGQVIASRIP